MSCDVSPPPSGTGNVNIEEAEKLLRPYLKRYPKVSLTSWQTPPAHVCPVDPPQTQIRVLVGRHLPVLCGAD